MNIQCLPPLNQLLMHRYINNTSNLTIAFIVYMYYIDYCIHFFFSQRYFQMFLVFIALICVPWMLLMKPIYMLIQHKRAKKVIHSFTKHNIISMYRETCLLRPPLLRPPLYEGHFYTCPRKITTMYMYMYLHLYKDHRPIGGQVGR